MARRCGFVCPGAYDRGPVFSAHCTSEYGVEGTVWWGVEPWAATGCAVVRVIRPEEAARSDWDRCWGGGDLQG